MDEQQSDLALAAWLVAAARIFGLAVTVLGALVLAGWIFDVALLKSVQAGWATMKPNAALGFLMAGAALLMAERRTPNAPWRNRCAKIIWAYKIRRRLCNHHQRLLSTRSLDNGDIEPHQMKRN